MLGAAAVGVYGVGVEIAGLPFSEIIQPLCRALFSGFVAERREGGGGGTTMLRVLSMIALLTFPFSVGLSLVAYPVVKLGFGQEWLAAVPLIQLLGVTSTIGLFNAIGETLFSAHAWLRTILSLTATTQILRLLLLLVMIPNYGLFGAALAGAIMGMFQEVIYLITVMRRLKMRLRAILASVVRPTIAVALMAIVLVSTGLGWTDQDGGPAELGVNLAEAVGLGAIVYVGSLVGLWIALGRPPGAEADTLLLIKRGIGRR